MSLYHTHAQNYVGATQVIRLLHFMSLEPTHKDQVHGNQCCDSVNCLLLLSPVYIKHIIPLLLYSLCPFHASTSIHHNFVHAATPPCYSMHYCILFFILVIISAIKHLFCFQHRYGTSCSSLLYLMTNNNVFGGEVFSIIPA